MKKHRRDAGFSLAALIFFATAASILAAAAVPAYQMQAKRERELELIFRGQEYTRAIQKYQRKFGVYPSSIDQLVQTNGLRFVRHAYKDPITGKDFRLIRINPDGSLSGSKVFVQNVNNPKSLFGNTQTFGQQPAGQPQQPGAPSQPGVPQQQSFQQPGLQPLSPSQQNLQQQSGLQPLSSSQQQSGLQPLSSSQQQFQQQQPSQQLDQRQGQPGGFTPLAPIGQSPIANVGGTPFAGGGSGGVIGVASDSDEASIMIYNLRQKYSEWEFLAILGQAGQQQPRGGQPQQPGQPPGVQGPSSPFGTPSSGSPFGAAPSGSPFGAAPSGSPFGPQPGGTPFGPGSLPGQQGGQQPFNFGNPAMPPAQPGPNMPGKLP